VSRRSDRMKYKKIQMTEAQAEDLYYDLPNFSDVKSFIKHLKEKDYIKKSSIEIAREEYKKIRATNPIDRQVLDDYIFALEKEIERLSG
jgi:hypothetical protein